ncbi:MAG TPA: GNAT family N-acetyltransferase [Blastocatellia bacterium]
MHSLKKPETESEKRAYHSIRRSALFEERGRGALYNENHPNESKPGNTPFLLMVDDRPVGTVRVDLPPKADYAILRLVAVAAAERNKGHGAHLLSLVETYARKYNRRRLVLNAAPDAITFYKRNGFIEQVWDDEELRMSLASVQMVKEIS